MPSKHILNGWCAQGRGILDSSLFQKNDIENDVALPTNHAKENFNNLYLHLLRIIAIISCYSPTIPQKSKPSNTTPPPKRDANSILTSKSLICKDLTSFCWQSEVLLPIASHFLTCKGNVWRRLFTGNPPFRSMENLNPEAFQWFVVHGPWSTMIPWVYLSGRTANLRKGPKKGKKKHIY